MSAGKVVHHPAFGQPPVKNPKRPGPKKGTISLNVERGRRKRDAMLREIEARKQVTANVRGPSPLVVLQTQRLHKALGQLPDNNRWDVVYFAEMLVSRYMEE